MNPTFTAHLVQVQRLKYQPNDPWVAGQKAYLTAEGALSVLTEAQAAQLNREDQQRFLDNCDKVPLHKGPDAVDSTTMIAPGEQRVAYLEQIATALRQLSEEYGSLTVLGDWNTPWLNQSNDYPPVAQALDFLRTQIDETFDGGFVLEGKEITRFIPHLFWLIRCNASLPEFMISFVRANFVVSICKYGVLHIAFYDGDERQAIMSFLRAKGFRVCEACADPVQFDDFDGRKWKVAE